MFKVPMRKARKKVEPAPARENLTEGVPVQSQKGSDEVTSHLFRTDVDEEPEADNSMLPEAPITTQIRTENGMGNFNVDIIMSREEAAKVGSMPESPWQEPSKIRNSSKTLTPRNLVQIMKQELKQIAYNPQDISSISPASPKKVLEIKERLQTREPMMGASHVRVNTSDSKVMVDPAHLYDSTINPQMEDLASEDMGEWYSKVP